MKRYGITELARLFGITPEAIRKYEAKGVLESRRNEQNSFREYDSWDISTLLHARKYTQAGFSVSQAAGLLNSSSVDGLLRQFERRSQELAGEIVYRQKLMKSLGHWERELREYQDQSVPYRFETRPETVFCQLYDDSDLTANQGHLEDCKRWMKHLPFASLGLIMKKEDVLSGSDALSTGMCAFQKDLDWLGLSGLPHQATLKERLCVTAMLVGSYRQPIKPRDFKPVFDFMEQQGCFLSGDVFLRVFLSRKEDGEYHFYHKAWFPIDLV